MMDDPKIAVKFAAQLLLSGKQAIASAVDEDLVEVFDWLAKQARPKTERLCCLLGQVTCPEDVDMLLDSSFSDPPLPESVKPEPEAQAPVPVQFPQEVQRDLEKMLNLKVLKPKPTVKLPRRWQPWKFVTAMVIPWLVTHATQRHEPRLSHCHPATLRKAPLPAVLRVVPMHKANWPK